MARNKTLKMFRAKHLVSTPTRFTSGVTHLNSSALTVDHLDPPDWKKLISDPLTAHERVFFITSIFSNYDQPEIDGNLSQDDHQTIVDMVDEVSLWILLLLRIR